MEGKGEVLLYETPDRGLDIQVRLEGETLWLSQKQMAELFDKDSDTIGLHIWNIYADGELEEAATTELFSVVQTEGKRQVRRQVRFHNLDVILSVGYRVSSRKGTQFRQWATTRLKEHLVRGYTLNEERLKAQQENIRQLERTLTLFQQNLIDQASLPEARGLVRVIADYARTFVLLNQFDSERLPVEGFLTRIHYEIGQQEATTAIAALKADLVARGEASDLFGNPKDNSFAGILGNIVQSFSGEYLYPSVEAQAAHLLYFVIKNHPFSDGNKRIGAFLFIWFLERNRHHLKASGELKINDNALAAIALLVAQSDPAQKELMIHLIMNLIRG
ncbi:MAG TPA: virulence protein RhuM/Fic/DOC family protein [Acidiferrobacterales bacterium]|nr:virulence protein RhuM/Fic/DOC family protein [Acidiferrobacterales bacterium]